MTDGLATVAVANAWLNTLRNTACSFPAVYVELHTANPTSNGAVATSAGAGTRIEATFAAASAGELSLTAPLGPWTNGGTTETLTDISLWTQGSGGTFLISLPLTVSKPWASGDTFTLSTLTLALSPLAA